MELKSSENIPASGLMIEGRPLMKQGALLGSSYSDVLELKRLISNKHNSHPFVQDMTSSTGVLYLQLLFCQVKTNSNLEFSSLADVWVKLRWYGIGFLIESRLGVCTSVISD